jgi:hypothetical protein
MLAGKSGREISDDEFSNASLSGCYFFNAPLGYIFDICYGLDMNVAQRLIC